MYVCVSEILEAFWICRYTFHYRSFDIEGTRVANASLGPQIMRSRCLPIAEISAKRKHRVKGGDIFTACVYIYKNFRLHGIQPPFSLSMRIKNSVKEITCNSSSLACSSPTRDGGNSCRNTFDELCAGATFMNVMFHFAPSKA